MTTYPLEAGEAEEFIPASLAHLPDAPKFYLRWGTPREKEQQRRVMDEEGATLWADDAMRDELLRGMKELFAPDDFETWQPLVKSWWDAIDAYESENKDVLPVDREPFVFDDQSLIIETLEQVARDWRPYRVMQADNNQYQRILGPAIASVIIERFDGADAPLRKRGRYLSYDCILTLFDRLDKFGRERAPGGAVKPSQELQVECLKRLYLDKDAEKNFASPAPSDPTPDTSNNGTGETNGSSTASAPSKRTRATKSVTRSGT